MIIFFTSELILFQLIDFSPFLTIHFLISNFKFLSIDFHLYPSTIFQKMKTYFLSVIIDPSLLLLIHCFFQSIIFLIKNLQYFIIPYHSNNFQIFNQFPIWDSTTFQFLLLIYLSYHKKSENLLIIFKNQNKDY